MEQHSEDYEHKHEYADGDRNHRVDPVGPRSLVSQNVKDGGSRLASEPAESNARGCQPQTLDAELTSCRLRVRLMSRIIA